MLGQVLICAGRYAEAIAELEECVAVLHTPRFQHPQMAHSHTLLVSAHMHLGHDEEALAQGSEALALAESIGNAEAIARARLMLGSLALAQPPEPVGREGDREAEELLTQSFAGLETGEESHRKGQALVALSCVACSRGDHPRARDLLYQTLQLADRMRVAYLVAFSLPVVARLYAVEGKTARAIELYALAMRSPVVANSQWFDTVAGQHVRSAGKALPVAAIAEAQGRGRARDLWETARQLLAEWKEQLAGGESNSQI
jgi:ATP/maltotriose-dependent transcriptional regulator MalT